MKLQTPLFKYTFQAAALVDIGQKRSSNQDEVITCPEQGFYAVSDGMGGLPNGGGGVTSDMIRQVLPLMVREAVSLLEGKPAPKRAAELLKQQVQTLSDNIYDTGNSERHTYFGATLSGVWLIGRHALFVNLGDSRGYLLPRFKKNIRQVTTDHNLAAILVELGKLSKEEARNHSSSSRLVQFAGMQAPAKPDVFICEVRPGDRLLLCSDGLYGMVDDGRLSRLMRSARRSPDRVCRNLVDEANACGGRDNISVVYLKILK
ncbi:MAG: protein phosphatase 2C domain-containing protein [Tannerella sp.]|jgi:serine/threonine protein phosphatase PrpC|nr:protein phosphatase 2C domain-containing protein [Tannerella sp.]